MHVNQPYKANTTFNTIQLICKYSNKSGKQQAY